MKGAMNALDGFVIQYNFLRRHMALVGRTPAEAANNPALPGFKWHELLKLVTTRRFTAQNVGQIPPDD